MTSVRTTLGALVSAEPALATLCALKLSAAAAYHLAKLARLVTTEAKHFHDARHRAITEMGTATGGGFAILPDSPAWPTFVTQLEELAAVAVEIPWGPITVAMLGDQRVAAADLAALGPLFAEPEADA